MYLSIKDTDIMKWHMMLVLICTYGKIFYNSASKSTQRKTIPKLNTELPAALYEYINTCTVCFKRKYLNLTWYEPVESLYSRAQSERRKSSTSSKSVHMLTNNREAERLTDMVNGLLLLLNVPSQAGRGEQIYMHYLKWF